MRNKLSAIITAGNEEHNIGDVINSVSFADEIIVVDSYSTDDTAEIARGMNVNLLQRKYDFPAKQKNWAIPQAENEWILLLDADERVPSKLKQEIQRLLQGEPAKDAYWIYRQNYFMGKKVRYSGWQGDKVIRLFRKSKCLYNDVKVHEEIEVQGNTGFLKNKLEHYTYKNLLHFIEKVDRYSSWGAYDRVEKVKNINYFHLLVKPLFTFIKKYFFQLGILDGKIGFILAVQYSYYNFLRSLKLWRIKKGEKV